VPIGRATAWLSLEDSDNDPALFWAYFIAALKTVAPGVGEGALALLSSTQSRTEAFVVTLLNGLAAVCNDVVVVLDDYHVIDEPHVQSGMAYLVASSQRTARPGTARRSNGDCSNR
jgi:LuxR family maltose regulon positive regulatory protein